MGKKKGKGLSPPSEEQTRFKDLLRKLVAVPKQELDEKMAERKRRKRRE
jgi:hypothetical protein